LPANAKNAGEVDASAGIAQSLVASYAQAVTSQGVMTQALQESKSSMALDDAIKSVRVTVPANTVVLDIVVTDKTREGAAALNNAITNQFVKQSPALMPKISSGTTLIQPSVLRPAFVPDSPSYPQRPLRDLHAARCRGCMPGRRPAGVRAGARGQGGHRNS